MRQNFPFFAGFYFEFGNSQPRFIGAEIDQAVNYAGIFLDVHVGGDQGGVAAPVRTGGTGKQTIVAIDPEVIIGVLV